MNFNFETTKLITSREFNLTKSSILRYEKNIIKSFYESTDQMYSLVRDFQKPSFKLCFSKDENLIAEDHAIWKFNDDYSFTQATKVFEIENSYDVMSIAFNSDTTKVVVGGSLSRFIKDYKVYIYDLETQFKENLVGNLISFYIMSNPIHSNIFAFETSEGIFLKDLREKNVEKLENCRPRVSFQYHPTKDNYLLVSNNTNEGVYVFDTRNRKRILSYKTFSNEGNDNFASYNKEGNKLFLIRTYSTPLLFNVNYTYPINQFDELGYCYRSPRLLHSNKNCCFAGQNDEFLVTPSDDNNVYIWQIPETSHENEDKKQIVTKINSAKYVLKNKSRTYSVAYNYKRSVLACCCKEETLKFWSIFPFYLKSDPKRDYSNLYDFFDEDFGYEFYPNSTIIEEVHHSIIFFYCSFSCDSKNNRDPYRFNVENSEIIFTEDFLNEFKQDYKISYVKSFLNNYNTHQKKKYFDYINELEKFLRLEIDFEEMLFKKNYLSLLSELTKVFYTKHFIIKSLKYSKQFLNKLEKLEKSFFFLNK